MRQSHSMISFRHVSQWATLWLLEALQWPQSPGRTVTPLLLVRLLIRAAVTVRSLAAVVADSQTAPSWETVRSGLFRYLPGDPQLLTPAVTRALHARLPKSLTKRPRTLAIDFHLRPFYGNKNTKGTFRGQPKAGTKTFFAFASVLVLRRGQTFTIGLTPVTNGEEQTAVIARLLQQAAAAGVQVRRLLLDRGFYAATTMHWLQQQDIAFILPMIRRGKKGRTKKDSTGTQPFFVPRRRGWDTYTFTARPRRQGRKQKAVPVTIAVCMVPRTQHGGKKKGSLVFACHKIRLTPKEVALWYRKRFRIETSYRQLGQSLAATCSTQASYRLLLVLIALMLRNVWVWLHWHYLSDQTADGRELRLDLLSLRTMTRWIELALDKILKMEPADIKVHKKTTNKQGAG